MLTAFTCIVTQVSSSSFTLEGDQNNAEFGISLASAGDVNGDGFSDVLVGADAFTNGELDEGQASLFLGSASGPADTPAWTAESNQAFAHFAISVATAGDVNGDGFSISGNTITEAKLRFPRGPREAQAPPGGGAPGGTIQVR